MGNQLQAKLASRGLALAPDVRDLEPQPKKQHLRRKLGRLRIPAQRPCKYQLASTSHTKFNFWSPVSKSLTDSCLNQIHDTPLFKDKLFSYQNYYDQVHYKFSNPSRFCGKSLQHKFA